MAEGPQSCSCNGESEKGDRQVKVIFKMRDGVVEGVSYQKIKGKESLTSNQMKDLKQLVNIFKQDMAQSFIDYLDGKKIHGLVEISKLPTE